jgi:hypothetical protein
VPGPDKDLLPKTVCPQKNDYYIQRGRLSAPGIGGRLTAKLPSNGTHRWQDNQSFHTDGHVNPWIHAPAYNAGDGSGGGNMFGAAGVWNNNAGVWSNNAGVWSNNAGVWSNNAGVWSNNGGVWNNNTFPLTSSFRNQHYQTKFPGAYELQTTFHQPTAMSSVLGNLAWVHNKMYGVPPFAPMLQNSRITHGHRPLWHNHTRPYHQPYYKRRRGRFQTQYNTTPTKLGKQHFENQTKSSDDFFPLTVEDKISKEAPETSHKDEGDGNDGDDEDVVECLSVSSAIKVENSSMDRASAEGQRHDGNKNGTDTHPVHQRRKRIRKLRCSVPPKKLQTLHEQLRLETKEQIRREDVLTAEVLGEKPQQEVLQQEDMAAADVSTWKDLKTVMQVVDLDSSNEGDNVYVDVNDTQGSETQNTEPLLQPEDCKGIGISELFQFCLPYCMNCTL